MAKDKKGKGIGRNGNLIPPVKGEIRNPNGRPKGAKNRTTIYRELLELAADHALKHPKVKIECATVADQIAVAMIAEAAKGNVAAAKEVMDSSYGKVSDSIVHGGDRDNPIKVDTTFEILQKIREENAGGSLPKRTR